MRGRLLFVGARVVLRQVSLPAAQCRTAIGRSVDTTDAARLDRLVAVGT